MIPVICTAQLSPERINQFLTETYDGYKEAAQYLVLITTKDWSYYNNDEAELSPEEARKQKSKVLIHGGGPMRVPSRPPWTDDFESPFLGLSPEDVAEALQSAEGAPGYLSKVYCAILDGQTGKDNTVLLVKTKREVGQNLPPWCEDSPIVQVRESSKEANGILQSADAGVTSLSGILWNQCAKKV